MQPFQDPPHVIGHRGAPRVAPENTPVAFAAAADAGASWVELDVRRSGDGALVVHHDARTADGTALIDRSADDLAALGVWTLPAVLESLPAGLGLDVEVKNVPGEPDFDEGDEAARAVAGALRGRIGERPLMTSSFSPITVSVLAEALPEVPAGLLHHSALETADARELAEEYGARVLCSEVGTAGLDPGGIEALHSAGLAVLVWTVDDLDEAERLAAAGVDAICTNDPAGLSARLSLSSRQ